MDFLLDLIHKAIETFVVVVVTAIAKWVVAKCKNKRKEKTTLTPRKRNKGGSKKKK